MCIDDITIVKASPELTKELDVVREKLAKLMHLVGKPLYYGVNERTHQFIVGNNTLDCDIEYHKSLDVFTLNGLPLVINNELEDGLTVYTPKINNKPINLRSNSTEFHPLRYEVFNVKAPIV